MKARNRIVRGVTTLATLSLLFAGIEAHGQGVEAPSDFQRQNDATAGNVGPEDEVDALDAQAEAIESGGSTPGLGGSGRSQVEEIVVQARRRAELLEDTPVAVSVLGEQSLRTSGITQLNEIQDLVPNMSVDVGASGLQPIIRIRGVGTSTIEAAFDPGVGVYVDGVFMPRSSGQLLDTVDVAQIEVLRGPQGTLFGKNTVGGAINVTTAKPTDEVEGFVMLRPGNFGSLVTRGMINLPLWEDKVMSRFSISSQSSNGYVENVFLNTRLSRLGAMNFIGALRFQLIDELTIDWSGQYSYSQNNGRGGDCIFVQPGAVSGLAPGFQPACEAVSGPFINNENVSTFNRLKSYGTWGVIQYDIGELGPIEDISVKSVTSWRKQELRNRTDLDQSSYFAIQLATAGGPSPTDGKPNPQQQIQQELQVNGTAWDGKINFVGGFFAFWEKAQSNPAVWVQSEFLTLLTANEIRTDNFTWALFGQATADFTDWLSLTAGLRYTSDRKSFEQLAFDPLTTEPPIMGTAEDTFTSWTPMATLATTMPEDWLLDTPVEHLMGYFTYSRGFKGGGFNAITQSQLGALNPTPFLPETLDNFEIGAKTIAFDGRLTANLALFYGSYDDIQVTQFITELDPDEPSGVSSTRVTRNAASATTKGVELEVVARPFEGWLINGSLGFVDATYDDFPDAENQIDNSIFNRAGESFLNAPKLNTFLAIQYSIPIEIAAATSMNGWLTPRLEWAYRSSYHIVVPEILDGTQRGYNLLNARLSYDFWDDRAQVALWARNLLDQAYFNAGFQAVTTFGFVSRYFQPPLTFGGELSYRF